MSIVHGKRCGRDWGPTFHMQMPYHQLMTLTASVFQMKKHWSRRMVNSLFITSLEQVFHAFSPALSPSDMTQL